MEQGRKLPSFLFSLEQNMSKYYFDFITLNRLAFLENVLKLM